MTDTVHLDMPSTSKIMYPEFLLCAGHCSAALLRAGHCSAVAVEAYRASVVPAFMETIASDSGSPAFWSQGPRYALKNDHLFGLSLCIFTILEIKPEKIYCVP